MRTLSKENDLPVCKYNMLPVRMLLIEEINLRVQPVNSWYKVEDVFATIFDSFQLLSFFFEFVTCTQGSVP